MNKAIKLSVDLLVCEAEKLLREYGLLAEQAVVGIIKVASDLVWDNANPDTEVSWVDWMTSQELYIAEYIGELHKETVKKCFEK